MLILALKAVLLHLCYRAPALRQNEKRNPRYAKEIFIPLANVELRFGN